MELKKLPEEMLSRDNSVENWMRFFRADTKEELRAMGEANPYFKEAYEMLEKLSANGLKRLEYEAREKAIRDYYSGLQNSYEEGERAGREAGLDLGVRLARLYYVEHRTLEEIAAEAHLSIADIKQFLNLE